MKHSRKRGNKVVPIVEKGISTVFGTMSKGVNLGVKGVKLGVKGVKTVTNKIGITKKRRSKRRTRTRRRY